MASLTRLIQSSTLWDVRGSRDSDEDVAEARSAQLRLRRRFTIEPPKEKLRSVAIVEQNRRIDTRSGPALPLPFYTTGRVQQQELAYLGLSCFPALFLLNRGLKRASFLRTPSIPAKAEGNELSGLC